jgi:hypothetical protein
MRAPRTSGGKRRAGYVLPAFLLAITAMLAQVATYAHLASAVHVTCAEHGELVEVGHAPSVGTPASRPADDQSVAESSAETRGHEHCAIAPRNRSCAPSQPARICRSPRRASTRSARRGRSA